jgi:isoleucyl-tRNA synthetase
MAAYNAPGFCKAAAEFIDDLSNWYIRRNRRRFWRSKDASDADKTAAYQTLHEVLVTLCKLLAPCMPFLTDRMYQNLSSDDAPESVHLCDYPQANASLLDEELNVGMAAAQLVVKLGHKLREENNIRVRQPLAELRFASGNTAQAAAVSKLSEVIAEELNVKLVTASDDLDEFVSYTYKPNLKTLGPKYGKLLGVLRNKLPELGDTVLGPLRRGQSLTVEIDGDSFFLTPADVLVGTEQASGWACADESGLQVAMSTALTDDLIHEGMARDFVRHVQQLRKDADLNIQDRIAIHFTTSSESVGSAIEEWSAYICEETLADSLEQLTKMTGKDKFVTVKVGDATAEISIAKR